MVMANDIVVTGATGTIGHSIVEQLHAGGHPVVAMVRDPDKRGALAAAGVRSVIGSFDDPGSLERAFAGAATVVVLTPANADADRQAIAAIEAAKAAGVRKVVRISALKAAVDGPTDNTRQHGRVEAALAASGLRYVILRPHLFLQNLLGALPEILGAGTLSFGVGDGRMGMVDTRDVADAAAIAATTDRFDGETVELTGPARIDYREVAAAITRGLGREVRYVPLTPAATADAFRAYGADAWTVAVLHDYCTAYARGWGDFTTGDVQRITGHAPRSVDDFVRDVLVPAARAAG
jgi:uncharacterized protein YbjT (DUF2867 family)